MIETPNRTFPFPIWRDVTVKQQDQKQEQEYGCITMEELRKIKLVSNTSGRPSQNLTDEKWQKEFNLRKLFVTPYDKRITKLGGVGSNESGKWNADTQGRYHGKTNWQGYCFYINDILKNIRKGGRDYCYYIFQIEDLLRFHHDNLMTKYCDGYWEVWLN